MEKQKSKKGWQRVLLIVLPYLIIVAIFQLLGFLLAGVDIKDFDSDLSLSQDVTVHTMDLIGTFIVLWIFMKYVDKERFIALGFETVGRLKEFNFGVGIGLVIMGLGYLFLILLDQIVFQKINFDRIDLLLSIVLFSIVAVVEETLMRGYVLRNLMLSFDKYIALIISSILFALIHWGNPNLDFFGLANLFLAGIVFGLSYLYTKNLWFPIAFHFSWNFFQSLFGFNVSGQDSYSLMEIGIVNENRWNGGEFGFEGSILSISSEIILILAIHLYYKRFNLKKPNEFS